MSLAARVTTESQVASNATMKRVTVRFSPADGVILPILGETTTKSHDHHHNAKRRGQADCQIPRCRYEVARFDTIQHSVDYYVLTINTNDGYIDLRNLRARLREESTLIRGSELALGLTRYSERGMDYVQEIQAMIRVNRLHQFTLDTASIAVTGD